MKNERTTRILASLALVAACAGGFLVGRAQADQPRMQAALDHLRAARTELRAADNDKGGHRVKAIEKIDQAIDHVEKGIRFDRRN